MNVKLMFVNFVFSIEVKCYIYFFVGSLGRSVEEIHSVEEVKEDTEVKEVEEVDDYAKGIREAQKAKQQARMELYKGSANDIPQFHREIFQQNSENLSEGEEGIAKIEQGFQDDANFDVAKWTNECLGNSTARVPLYARGKGAKHKDNLYTSS